MDKPGAPTSGNPLHHSPISVPGRRPQRDSQEPRSEIEELPFDESAATSPDDSTSSGPIDIESTAGISADELHVVPQIPFALVVACSALGSLLFAICLSPLGLGQLAFLTVAPWAWLVLDARRMSFLRYGILYACAWLSWNYLLLIEADSGLGKLFVNGGLIAYVSSYLPLFVWLGRIMRRTIGVPSYLSLPFVWCGLEWLRCHLLGGVSLGMLGHAVADTTRVMQLADLAGSYGLGMLMVASGASIAELVWLSRRIRRLEKKLPRVASTATDTSRVFTSTGRFLVRPRFNHAKTKKTAQSSFEHAMRRNRDRARDLHFVSVAISVSVVVGVLVFANSYGQSRVEETRIWKMFEANQFPWTVVGGPDSERILRERSQRDADSLLVTAVNSPISLDPPQRPVLLIAPDQSEAANHRNQWRVVLGDREKPLTNESSEGLSIWLRSSAIAPFLATDDLPCNLIVTLSSSASVEQIIHDALRGLPRRGDRSSIDAAIVVIQPGRLDPRSWPRLLTRSVAAAAVANRCPIIAIIPEETVAIANGDGKLVWSSVLADGDPGSGDPFATKESIAIPIQIQSMIDPRIPSYLGPIGHPIGQVSFLLTCLVPIGGVYSQRRRTT